MSFINKGGLFTDERIHSTNIYQTPHRVPKSSVRIKTLASRYRSYNFYNRKAVEAERTKPLTPFLRVWKSKINCGNTGVVYQALKIQEQFPSVDYPDHTTTDLHSKICLILVCSLCPFTALTHTFFCSKIKLIRIKLKFLNKTLVSLMFYFYSSETDIVFFLQGKWRK